MSALPNSTSFSAIIASSFTRPDDTAQYAVGDLVANSTTAASVVPLSFANASIATGNVRIDGARIRKSTNSVTSASFRLHLFHTAPSVATTGDNGVFGTVVSGAANYLGAIDITVDRAFADGAAGSGIPMRGSPLNVHIPSGQTIFGLLEARGTYTPGPLEAFTVSLEVFRFAT